MGGGHAAASKPAPFCIKEKRKGCGTRKLTPRRDWTWGVVQKGAPCAHPARRKN
jgi:hypothetical protein